MITFGVDAHKQVHMVVAVDALGARQGTWRGANTPAGWQEVHQWAVTFGEERQ